MGIADDHRRKLMDSGLRTDTVVAAGIHTERRPLELAMLLNGCRFEGPALVFPYFDRHGSPTDHAVARPSSPRASFKTGKPVKYEMPFGKPCEVYFPPLRAVLDALNAPGWPLLITEGILKALAASQAGVPCLGLMGTWNWVVGGSDPKALLPGLADIDWRGRPVMVVYDHDRRRNPQVNHAAAELARVLNEHGADVRVPLFPPGPPGPQFVRRGMRLLSPGPRTKQGLDDFIVRLARRAGSAAAGDEEFRRWVEKQLADPPTVPVEWWRAELARLRVASIGWSPGVYLDRSPTGAGKSFADLAAMKTMGTV